MAYGKHGRHEKARIISVRKQEQKTRLGRSKHGWKNDIKVVPKKIGYEGVEYINLAQDKDWWWGLVDMAVNLQAL
jgi:hypothetical protein